MYACSPAQNHAAASRAGPFATVALQTGLFLCRQPLNSSACLQMGPMSRDERIMAAVMVGAVILWVGGESLGVASVTAAMLGLSALLLTGVLSWRDCLTYTQVRLSTSTAQRSACSAVLLH